MGGRGRSGDGSSGRGSVAVERVMGTPSSAGGMKRPVGSSRIRPISRNSDATDRPAVARIT